jgi:glycosyltransferase involved in cell wall biosynthesis
MKKKLLIITPHFPPFPRVGTVRRIENFVRYLPEYGWEPVVLTMDWGYADRSGSEKPRIYHTRNIAVLSWNAYRSTEVASARSWKNTITASLIQIARTFKNYALLPDELILWTFWVLPKLGKIIREEKPHALFVNGPPFSTLLIGVLVKLIYHLPLVSDVRDDWVDNPLTEKQNRVLRQIERRMERFVVHVSDAVIVVTPASHALWSRRYPEWSDKIHLLPNGYNEEEFSAVSPYPFDDFALVHAGSLEGYRSPELIFRALAGLEAQAKNIGFYQYGLTIRDYKILAAAYGLQDVVHFEDLISGREAVSRIKGASALVLIPTWNAPTAIPGKAYEYLRSGKQIILISPPNTTTDFLEQFSQVHHVLPGDEIRLKEIIEQLISLRETPIDAESQEVLKQFDRKVLTGELATLLSSVAKGNR